MATPAIISKGDEPFGGAASNAHPEPSPITL